MNGNLKVTMKMNTNMKVNMNMNMKVTMKVIMNMKVNLDTDVNMERNCLNLIKCKVDYSDDFIVLPTQRARPPTSRPCNPLSHIIPTLSQAFLNK